MPPPAPCRRALTASMPTGTALRRLTWFSRIQKIGTATAAASETGNTTITATLTDEPTGNLIFLLHGSTWDYTGQVGLLTGTNSISKKYDYATGRLNSSDYTVDGLNIIPKSGATIAFSSGMGGSCQAIVKFTLVDKDNNNAAINATSLTLHDTEGNLVQSFNFLTDTPVCGDLSITSSGTNEIYVALRNHGSMNLTLTATDGTDTYTYTKSGAYFSNGEYYPITVKMTKQAAATTYDIGKIVGADGNIYATKADAEAVATGNAVAIIAYVGSETGNATYNHGLAIALADDGKMNWTTAKSTCEGMTAVTNAKWYLPSEAQWQTMVIANGGSTSNWEWEGLNTTITNAGGTPLQSKAYYWSSTEINRSLAYSVYLSDENKAGFFYDSKSNEYQVRACLAF